MILYLLYRCGDNIKSTCWSKSSTSPRRGFICLTQIISQLYRNHSKFSLIFQRRARSSSSMESSHCRKEQPLTSSTLFQDLNLCLRVKSLQSVSAIALTKKCRHLITFARKIHTSFSSLVKYSLNLRNFRSSSKANCPNEKKEGRSGGDLLFCYKLMILV